MTKRMNAVTGPIVDGAVYAAPQLAEILGKSERAMKDSIRANVTYAEPMEGMLSGEWVRFPTCNRTAERLRHAGKEGTADEEIGSRDEAEASRGRVSTRNPFRRLWGGIYPPLFRNGLAGLPKWQYWRG